MDHFNVPSVPARFSLSLQLASTEDRYSATIRHGGNDPVLRIGQHLRVPLVGIYKLGVTLPWRCSRLDGRRSVGVTHLAGEADIFNGRNRRLVRVLVRADPAPRCHKNPHLPASPSRLNEVNSIWPR